MPKISIIIPNYNTDEKKLLECVNSILQQTFLDYEVIIIDDGSKDEYRTIYKSVLQLDSRIKVVFKENEGVSVARNFGTNISRGEYIIYSDADDRLIKTFLEEAYQIIQEKRADMVIGCNQYSHLFEVAERHEKIRDELIVTLDNAEINILNPFMVGKGLKFYGGKMYIGRGPWARIIKKEIAINTPFDPSLTICEDIVWNLQILKKASRICYVKRIWYLYSLYMDSTSNKYNPNAILEAKKGLEKLGEVLNLQKDEEYKVLLDRYFEDMLRICKSALMTGNRLDKLSKKAFYNESPWVRVKERRYFRVADNKTRIKIFLYRMKLLFNFYELIYGNK